MAQRRRLTQLPRDLSRLTGAQVTYRRIYTLAVDGRIPANQAETGHWSYDANDVPAIAVALGLSLGHQAAA